MRKLSALLPAIVVVALIWSLPAVAQTQTQPQTQMQPQSQMAAGMQRPEYMEVYMVKVKPEKRAEFDAVARKIADANRRNDGDMWIAWEIAYGEPNTIYFASPRMNFADVQNRNEAFRAALRKAYGPDGEKKLMEQLDACTLSERSELRRIRWDLSSGWNDMAAIHSMVGQARWQWTTEVHVRPGRMNEAEDLIRMTKQAHEQADPKYARIVEESMAGEDGSVLYIATLEPAMGEYDAMMKTPAKTLLGEQGYEKFMKGIRDITVSYANHITRPIPELSNVPQEIASAAPSFWTPGGPALATARPRTKRRAPAATAGEARR